MSILEKLKSLFKKKKEDEIDTSTVTEVDSVTVTVVDQSNPEVTLEVVVPDDKCPLRDENGNLLAVNYMNNEDCGDGREEM